MVRWIQRVLFFAVVVTALGFLLYTKVLRPVQVAGYDVVRSDLVVEVMGTGSVQARVSSVISSKIQGQVIELSVDQGSVVVAGQVIARLDDRDLISQVEIAQANAQASQAGLERLVAERARSEAVLRQADRELARVRQSFEQGAANDSEIDKSEEQLAIAQADLASSQSAIAEGKMLVIAAQKSLEYQQAKLDDTVIAAPFDGLIIRRDRDPGDIIVPGSAIYQLIALDEIWVSAWVDETAMAGLLPDQPARIILRSQPDHPLAGRVVRLGKETDPETREFVVDVAIDNLPEHWAIGQRADVYIETDRIQDALAVPMMFVETIDGERGVYTKVGNRAKWTPCAFGSQGRDSIEIMSGIKVGDVLVRISDPANQKALRDQKKVTAK
ncbi:efflux RND transporter periplasmic adaptor subunit [Phycisphaeraceae bacterium AH-315-B13]|nr:efflux RND transporter periplasmic adaptor subunit [Phycisphaeraceae bacterium AH-315-B13]